MPKIELDIPAQHTQRVIKALCRGAGLTDPADHTPANAKAALVEHIRRTVKNLERGDAERAAIAAVQDPDTDGIAS